MDLPEADSYDPKDPELIKALSKYSVDYENKLTRAIDQGSLKTTKIRRDLNDVLNTNYTLISYENLYDWLFERGHEPGEAFKDFLDEEGDIHSHLIDEIYAYRVKRKCGKSIKDVSKAKLRPRQSRN